MTDFLYKMVPSNSFGAAIFLLSSFFADVGFSLAQSCADGAPARDHGPWSEHRNDPYYFDDVVVNVEKIDSCSSSINSEDDGDIKDFYLVQLSIMLAHLGDYESSFKVLSEPLSNNDEFAFYVAGISQYIGSNTIWDAVFAIDLLEKSASLGYLFSYLMIADIYHDGQIGEKYWPELVSNQQAIRYAQMSGYEGHLTYDYILGSSLFDGLGITKDEDAGIDLLKRAANQGSQQSIYLLYLIYSNEERYLDLQIAGGYFCRLDENLRDAAEQMGRYTIACD